MSACSESAHAKLWAHYAPIVAERPAKRKGGWLYAPLTGHSKFVPGAGRRGEDAVDVKLMPEYSAGIPLWGQWKPLELSASLLARLRQWQLDFDSSFHWETGWQSEVARERWSEEARQLEADLRTEIGNRADVTVDLWPLKAG